MNIVVFCLFLLFGAANVAAVHGHRKKAERLTKPFLMPLLLLFYLLSAPKPDVFIFSALIFGFLGDVFLLGKSGLFTAGVLSFLLGHICYIFAFLKTVNIGEISLPYSLPALPYLLFGVLFFRKLLPYLKKDQVQAVLYLTCILGMSFAALLRISNVGGLSFLLPYVGSLLFILSDSVLAVEIYRGPVRHGEVLVMTTYLCAEAMIVIGMLL